LNSSPPGRLPPVILGVCFMPASAKPGSWHTPVDPGSRADGCAIRLASWHRRNAKSPHRNVAKPPPSREAPGVHCCF
jgi:hypothetical protein